MKKYVNKLMMGIVVVGLAMIIIRCDDILEEDISNESVNLIHPKSNDTINGNAVQFRWDYVQGAEDYRIEVKNIESNTIILDSLVQEAIFDFTIDPGSYSWSVRGENFAYATPFAQDEEFSVITSSDLTRQTVKLLTPANESFLKEKNIELSWERVSEATFYDIKISEVVDNKVGDVVFDNKGENIVGTSINLTNNDLPKDGRYQWEIKAGNESSNSDFFVSRFSIDTQKPPAPALLEPTVGQTIALSTSVVFKWEFTDTGDFQSDIVASIQIASDSEFNNVVHSAGPITETEYSFMFSEVGTYFWRIKLEDKAKNSGDFSAANQVIIN